MSYACSFESERAQVLRGTLRTAHPERLAAALLALFPTAPGDPERECACTPESPAPRRRGRIPVRCHVHHDAWADPDDLARALHTACPDATGTLDLIYAGVRVGDQEFGAQLRFRRDGVAIHRLTLTPEPTPWQRFPTGTPGSPGAAPSRVRRSGAR